VKYCVASCFLEDSSCKSNGHWIEDTYLLSHPISFTNSASNAAIYGIRRLLCESCFVSVSLRHGKT
ncbi:hypothetical protein MKX03_020149, partial [Papaver bracteatum]